MYRIAFLVTRSDHIGGSHIHVRDLALALQKDGHNVTVFIGGKGPVIQNFQNLGLNVVRIPSMRRNIAPFFDIRAYKELKKEVALFYPDIITTHSSKAGFLGRIVAWKLDIPVIFTVHGWAFTDGKSKIKRAIYKILEKVVVPVTDKIVAVSNYDKELGIQQLNLSNDQILTIHNGVTDINHTFMARHDQQYPVNIVMVARFDPPKDQKELLKATYNIENIHIHFVGDGGCREEVDRLAEELGFRDRITFWGELDSVVEVLAQSQIFALISNWEGFPNSTLEAMRAELPVVVSDVGGAAEAIEHGVTGYAVPKGNIQALHDVIEELAQNPEKRKKMGAAARKRFEKNYTFQTMYEKTSETYTEVIMNNRKN